MFLYMQELIIIFLWKKQITITLFDWCISLHLCVIPSISFSAFRMDKASFSVRVVNICRNIARGDKP